MQGLHFYKKQYVLLLFKNHIKSHTTHTLLENNNNKKTAQELQAQNRTSNINMQDKINKKKVTDKVLIEISLSYNITWFPILRIERHSFCATKKVYILKDIGFHH